MDGIEQVYTADSEVGIFTRERSKMSREERIAAAKAAREAPRDTGRDREKWGPGGEVVQELKEMISRVAERKRRMASDAEADEDVNKVSA